MMPRSDPVIHRNPEILGGTPVFAGTRVPQALIDYLEGGHSLDDYWMGLWLGTHLCLSANPSQR